MTEYLTTPEHTAQDAPDEREDTPAAGPPSGAPQERSRSLARDAWLQLRRKPMFLVSAAIILVVIVMAIFPQLFTSLDPHAADLSKGREKPSGEAWFGYDTQGRSVYARVIHGARASLLVGLLSTLTTILLGSFVGLIAGYFGRFLDSLLSRLGEIFAGIPFILGAIVLLTTLNADVDTPSQLRTLTLVVLSMTLLVWPISMRIMRSAVLSTKENDYVAAARGLGASTGRILFRHILPNSVAPVLVYATIALGQFIGLEATLAYLGVGLRPPSVSWGVMVSDASSYVQTAPHMLLFPAGFIVLTVLAFVMLGDAVRDAFDPKTK